MIVTYRKLLFIVLTGITLTTHSNAMNSTIVTEKDIVQLRTALSLIEKAAISRRAEHEAAIKLIALNRTQSSDEYKTYHTSSSFLQAIYAARRLEQEAIDILQRLEDRSTVSDILKLLRESIYDTSNQDQQDLDKTRRQMETINKAARALKDHISDLAYKTRSLRRNPGHF